MPSPIEVMIIVLECTLLLGGLGILSWLFLSSAGRVARARPAALTVWEVSLTDFLFFVWLVLTLGFFGQGVLRMVSGHTLGQQADGATLELVLYGSMFHVGAILAWLCCHHLERRRQTGKKMVPLQGRVPWWELGGSAVLTFLVVVPLASGAGLLWEFVLKAAHLPMERQELVDLFTQTKSPALLSFMVVLALGIAPVSEELVFRAGLFRFLRTRIPRWAAYGASAGLFALLHANWTSFLPLLVLGVVFAVAYERTGHIVVPMLAHALFNLHTLLLVLSGVGN
jgi:hypothetical protein